VAELEPIPETTFGRKRFCRDGTVYFKEDIATAVNKYLLQTALEEVAHHVTGATDMSRDFQNFLIQVLVETKA